MNNSLVIYDAADDYKKAEDLAILIRRKRIELSLFEIQKCQRIFQKWMFYFADKAKEANCKNKKQNYLYLKNRFKGYYKSLK